MPLIPPLLIPQIPIHLRFFTPHLILYLSLPPIPTFTTPTYDLTLPNNILTLIILPLLPIFKLNPLIIPFTFLLIYLTS
ncbi:spore germination protein, partial [Bacillus sp. WP8]|uniref:spore germination protein n=1 Tax=Bacillus sp. WP8 TaxID=756828 RepID=UPI0028CB7AB5